MIFSLTTSVLTNPKVPAKLVLLGEPKSRTFSANGQPEFRIHSHNVRAILYHVSMTK